MHEDTGELRMLAENETPPPGCIIVPTRYEKRAMKLVREGKAATSLHILKKRGEAINIRRGVWIAKEEALCL